MATKDKIVNLEDLKVLSDHVEGEVTDLKSDLNDLEECFTDGLRHFTRMVNGSWSGSSTASPYLTTNVTTRIRPAQFIDVKRGDKISIDNGTAFKHAVGLWIRKIGNAEKVRSDSEFISTTEIINVLEDGFFIVSFANSSDITTNVNPEDFDGSVSVTSFSSRTTEKINATLYQPELFQYWKEGIFDPGTGNPIAATGYIRNDTTFAGVYSEISKIEVNDGYLMRVFAYDASGNYVGTLLKDGSFKANYDSSNYALVNQFDCALYPNYRFKVSIRRHPYSADIVVSEGSNVIFYRAGKNGIKSRAESAIQIAYGTDLNSLTNPGTYSSYNSSISETLIHTPTSNNGFLMYVVKLTNIDRYHQIAIENANQPKIYLRTNAGNGWSDWNKIVNSSDMQHFVLNNADVAVQLSSGDDLDNFISPGTYSSYSSAISAAVQHSPYSNTGYLLYVLQLTNLERYAQIAIPNSRVQGIKYRVNSGSGWSEWKTLLIDPTNTYVDTEVDRVAANVRAVQNGRTLTMIGVSDLHYREDVELVSNAIHDMSVAVEQLHDQIHIDYDVDYGDVIYAMWAGDGLTSRVSYTDGVLDYLGVTKKINGSFGNRKQIRMVGNHDMNSCDASGTKAFTMDMIYSYFGSYNEDLIRPDTYRNRGYGYIDDDYRKLRIIYLNTSDFGLGSPNKGDYGNVNYYMSADQTEWLIQILDLSAKSDAANWQIILMSHIPFDQYSQYGGNYPVGGMVDNEYPNLLYAYETGGNGTLNGKTYNFSGKNIAKLALFIHGHTHAYTVDNMHYKSGSSYPRMNLARICIPNALPGREASASVVSPAGSGIDWGNGETYPKTAGTATSTAFVVNTIDPDNKAIYSHHYGAGIDRILHYDSIIVTESVTLTSTINPTSWVSMDTSVATVNNGVVTPVTFGNVMVYARAEDGTREYWNLSVSD